MPEVSVVVPAHNAESTLAATIDSALAQTFADLEVIVVDDGSTDDTAKVVLGFSDPRVKLVVTSNGGVSRARNRGIGMGRGELIALLDADDTWLPEKVERQVSFMRSHPEVGLCSTAAIRVDAGGDPIGPIPVLPFRDYCLGLLMHSMIAGCVSSGMVRREVVSTAGGFDPKFSQGADWDFWLRASLVTPVKPLPLPLVRYRDHSSNMSKDVALLERDTFGVLDKFFLDARSAPYRPFKARIYSNHWMICSGSYLRSGALTSSIRCLAHGVSAYPANAGKALGLPRRWVARRIARTA